MIDQCTRLVTAAQRRMICPAKSPERRSEMKSNSLIAVLILLAVVLGCARFSRSSGTEPGASPTSKSPSRAGAAPTRSTGERGTPDEAKAMLQQAIAHYKDVGRQQALADFNAKKPPFGDRDLYVACIGPDHVLAANGGYPTLVGTSADGWKDADGQSLGKASYEAVASGGSGSIH